MRMSSIRRVSGMASVKIIRQDLDASQLRAEAGRTADAKQVRRILAIAMVLDGYSRWWRLKRAAWTGRRYATGSIAIMPKG
jgi:hypothetical protein